MISRLSTHRDYDSHFIFGYSVRWFWLAIIGETWRAHSHGFWIESCRK